MEKNNKAISSSDIEEIKDEKDSQTSYSDECYDDNINAWGYMLATGR